MVILIRFIVNVSLLYNALSHIISNDDHHYNYSCDNVNHQKQYSKSSFHQQHPHPQQQHQHPQQQHPHPQQQDQLSHRQLKLTSFDWKFYMTYNNDLQSVGINNESLATNHYQLYGKVVYMFIPA